MHSHITCLYCFMTLLGFMIEGMPALIRMKCSHWVLCRDDRHWSFRPFLFGHCVVWFLVFFSGFCSCFYLQCTSLCLWWIHAFMHTVFSLHIKQCMKSPLEHLLLNFRWTVSEISLLCARVKSRRTGMTLV